MADTRNWTVKLLRACAAGLVVVIATLAVAEIIIRILNPVPPVQVIRRSRIQLFDAGEVPVWTEERGRMNLSCPDTFPEAEVVIFSGDSIFFGSGVENGREFTAILQAKLDSAHGRGRWCILNLSQPGYSLEQKDYWLKTELGRHRIGRVFWEVWPNDIVRYRQIRGDVYNFGTADAGRDRLPPVLPGPPGFRIWLFDNSRLAQYLTLTVIAARWPQADLCNPEYMDAVRAIRARVEAAGSRFIPVLATRLDRTFEKGASLADPFDPLNGQPLAYECTFDGFETLRLDRMFLASGSSHLDVRVDECCHYNRKGHERLADMFFDILTSTVDDDSAGVRKTDK